MILKSLNNLDQKYGFANALEYEDESYHGHQRGIAVCIMNQDGSFYRNMIVPLDLNADKDELTRELLKDKKVKLLVDDMGFLDEVTGLPIKRTVYYLPYAVINHSCFKPTINYDGVDDDSNNQHQLTIEVLLCSKCVNRYFTIETTTVYDGPIQILESFLHDTDAMKEKGFEYIDDEEAEKQGTKKGWYIDMYNEAGPVGLVYVGDTIPEILSKVNSLRIIDINTISSSNDGNNEQETENVVLYSE